MEEDFWRNALARTSLSKAQQGTTQTSQTENVSKDMRDGNFGLSDLDYENS